MSRRRRVWSSDLENYLLTRNGKKIPTTNSEGFPSCIPVHEIEKIIDELPSADPVPAVWTEIYGKDNKKYLKCSKCNNLCYNTDVNVRFCPYCGAECKR